MWKIPQQVDTILLFQVEPESPGWPHNPVSWTISVIRLNWYEACIG
jgi:hypothetical protein